MNAYANALDRLRTPAVAATLVRLGAAYVLLGAAMKLFAGDPGDLPTVLLDLMPRHIEGLFMLAVSVELFVGLLALVAPRLGWSPLALLMTAFTIVLAAQVIAGERSCGCFGSAIVLPPLVMLPVDAALLAAILLARPWSALRDVPWRAWSAAIIVPVVAGALAYLSSASAEPAPQWTEADRAVAAGASREDSESTAAAPVDESTIEPDDVPVEEADDRSESPRTVGAVRPRSTWQPPTSLPRYVVLKPWQWIDTPIWETQLATFVDTARFPLDATVILYMETCDHCAEHLHALADRESLDTEYVLVQLPTPSRSVHPTRVFRLPRGEHVRLPSGTRWRVQVPWELTLEGGIVVDAVNLNPD